MLKNIITILSFFCFVNCLYATPHTGIIKSYSQHSDWGKKEHKVYLEFTLESQEDKVHSVQFNLNVEEMIEFTTEQNLPLIIIEELPDILVGQSLFQFQLGENPYIYQGKGRSIFFKTEDWKTVDEASFMVTEVALPQVTLNSCESILVTSIIGDPIGKVFSRYPVEHFIPDKPGLSNFIYYSQDQESFLMYQAPSKDSHWTPFPEQMKKGNRRINVGEGWVDLDAAKFMISQHTPGYYSGYDIYNPPTTKHIVVRDLVNTWDDIE